MSQEEKAATRKWLEQNQMITMDDHDFDRGLHMYSMYAFHL